MDRPQRSRRTKTRVDYAGLEEDGGGSDNDFADAPKSASKKSKAAAPKEQSGGAGAAGGDQRSRSRASRLDRQAKLEERFNNDLQHAIDQSLQTVASASVRSQSPSVRLSKIKPLNRGDDSDDCGDADDFKAGNTSVIVVDDDDCSVVASTTQAKPKVAKKASVIASSSAETHAGGGICTDHCPILERQDVVTPRKRGRPKKDVASPVAATIAAPAAAHSSAAVAAGSAAKRTAKTQAGATRRAPSPSDSSFGEDGNGHESSEDDLSAEDVEEDDDGGSCDSDSDRDEDENRRPTAEASSRGRRSQATAKSPTVRLPRSATKSHSAAAQPPSACLPAAASVASSCPAPCRWKPPTMLSHAPPTGRSGSGGCKVGSTVVATAASRSPGVLRLGLSKMTRLKPLHPSVKSP